MSQVRRLWAVLMLSVEKSLAAFRVSPDLVGHSQVVQRRVRPDDGSHSPAEGTTSIRRGSWLSVARGTNRTKGK
jgi:hypothetical protein